VPDVSIVIDLGFEKLPFFDAATNTDSLLLRRASRASAMQRAGRAGRVAPGVCLRLFPQSFLDNPAIMPSYAPAEMERTALLNLLLKVRLMDPTAPAASVLSEAIQPPSAARVDAALRRLVALGALSGSGEATRVTSLGRLIAALPVSAPLGRLLVLGDAFGCGRQTAVIAALLSLPDPFLQPYTRADAAPADGDYEAEAKLLSDDISFFKPRLAHFTKRGCSDALATLAMFDEWQRVLSDDGPPAAAQYAHSQHASYKRLAEVEHFSRELSERLKQQRNEFGITAPHAGSAVSRGEPPSLLVLQSLLCAAFAPNFAAGRTYCPPRVLDDFAAHNVDVRRAVNFTVSQGSQGGAHITQAHLAAALQPCGELKQALISKSRAAGNTGGGRGGASDGGVALQTTATLLFATPLGAQLALRMAGLKGSLPVPLTDDDDVVVGVARLQAPQHSGRLAFERYTAAAAEVGELPAAAVHAPSPHEPPAHADADGGAILPVDLNWHSASAVLCDDRPPPAAGGPGAAAGGGGGGGGGERFLLAAAWSRGASQSKLIAQSAALLPAKPGGAAQLLMVALSRAVRLLPAPDGSGAVAAQLADAGQRGVAFTLPWLLKATEVDELNALRAALSALVGAHPREAAESASSVQLRLMQLFVASRPPLPPALAATALQILEKAPPFEGPAAAVDSAAMFPPLVLPAPPQAPAAAAPAAAGDDDDDELLAYDDGSSGPAPGGGEGAAVDFGMDEDDDLELLEG